MAQHDYDLSNQNGALFRSDVNAALAAIVSLNSGASAPTTTFAGMWWHDTSNNLLKLRNLANSAWITVLRIDETGGVAGAAAAGLPKGSSRAAWLQAGGLWVSDATSPWTLNVYDGADDIPIGKIDPTNNVIALQGSLDVAPAQVTSGTSITIAAYTAGLVKRIQLTGNATITLPTIPATSDTEVSLLVELVQDATGSRTVTWAVPGGVTLKWDQSASAPAIATAASKETHHLFRARGGGSVWYGSRVWKEN